MLPWLNFTPDTQQVPAERFSFFTSVKRTRALRSRVLYILQYMGLVEPCPVMGCMQRTVTGLKLFIYLFISLLHRTSQRKAIIKGEGELDV